uniref:Terminase n=1 Tax=Dulem virus 32 TaxID=3145750 RepID=A0AAU8B0L3_9CAUD
MRLPRRPQPQTRPGLLPEAHLLALPEGITSTAGPSIIAVAEKIGLGLDPWQRGIAQIAWAKTADGGWASEIVALSIPRQAGKTYLVAAMVFAYCLIHPGTTVAWTAHHNKVMLEVFDSLRAVAGRPQVALRVAKINASAENRSIRFTNGSRIVMAARESGALRGVAKVSILVLDEAQILTSNAMSDMLPTQNQATHPLTIMLGTPPRPKDPGEVFTEQRDAALAAIKAGRPLEEAAWIEFSAPPDCETDDKEAWRQANPSYPKRTPLRAVRKLRRSLTEDHFRREALGIWDDLSTPAVVPPNVWAGLVDEKSKALSKLVLAIDVSPNRDRAAVGLAGLRGDDLAHVELDESREGTGWIVDYVAARCANNPIAAVVVDAKSPAASLVRSLKARKVRVVTTNTEDMTDACADMVDACMNNELRHIAQPQLTLALNSARKRSIGERWAWNRKSAESDITPIVAITLALWGVRSRRVRNTAAVTPGRQRGGAVW